MGTVRRAYAAAGAAALVLASTGCDQDPPPVPAGEPAAAAVRTGRAPNAPFDVTTTEFGIHSYTTKPEVPAGAFRMACTPTWSTLEPAPGRFQWAEMDAFVSRAEFWGFPDIVVSLCGTPAWAGTPVQGTDVAAFGPGTAQPPQRMSDWADYVRAIAERYRGRISGYEVWNEPTSPQFFTGTPRQMAQMTDVAAATIRSVDDSAFVLSGSVQAGTERYRQFGIPYLRELARLGWPVDGIAAHFYPQGEGTPARRVTAIRQMQADLTELDAPADLPLWDTEVNYDVGRPGGAPDGRVTGRRAAAWTAQTFLDSWRTGVRRTYWYLWTQEYYDFPGIQLRSSDPATTAYTTLSLWLTGSRFDGCRTPAGTVVCRFTTTQAPFTVAWAQRPGAHYRLPGPGEVCPVDGTECRRVTGVLDLDEVPVRITTSG